MVTPLRTLAKRCRRLSPLLAAPAALLMSQGQAKAVLTYNIFESGGNVILRTSGSLMLPTSPDIAFSSSPFYYANNTFDGIGTGPQNTAVPYYLVQGPGNLIGSGFYSAQSGTGFNTGLFVGSIFNGQKFSIDSTYSGGEIISEAVIPGITLADLGITSSGLVGTWTLQPANGSDPYTAFDTIQVVIGAPPSPSTAVPGPLPLFGAAAAFGWSRRLRKRITAPLITPPQA
jgi:hypothetical protein